MVGLKPGWYPQDDGTERFWDGSEWTDAIRKNDVEGAGDTTPTDETGSPELSRDPAGGSKGCLYIVGIFVLICIAIGFSSCGGDGGSDDAELRPYMIQSTCHDIIEKQLKNPSTADFNDETQGSSFAAGSVAAQNALGGVVTYTYRCSLDSDGSTVRLESFTER